jgi:hypothetical protein
MKTVFSIVFFFFLFVGYAQDTTFVKVYYAGSRVIIPQGKTWIIEKAFINGGAHYNIQISTSNFKKEYISDSELILPYYIAEMELLGDKSTVSYILTIHEVKTQ